MHYRKIALFFTIVLSFHGLSTFAMSNSKIALVVGNAAYPTASLRNPVQDAKEMAASLSELGFEVQLVTDTSRSVLYQSIREFGVKIAGASTGLFYYAGHGVQVNGSNFLVPVDADVQAEDEVPFQCIDAAQVVAKMESAGCAANIVILDACRDNPFGSKARSLQRGLSVVSAPKGTLLVYSTAPGQTAADGAGENSVFTGALLSRIGENQDLETILREVRNDVLQVTGEKQTPWTSSSLTAALFLGGSMPPSAQAKATASMSAPSRLPAKQIPQIEGKTWDGVIYRNYKAMFAEIDKTILNTEFHKKY